MTYKIFDLYENKALANYNLAQLKEKH